jgi:ribosomal protein L15E
MTRPPGYRSSLAHSAGCSPSSETEVAAMRRAARRYQGLVVLRGEDVRDDWTRHALLNEINRLYGRRSGDGQ